MKKFIKTNIMLGYFLNTISILVGIFLMLYSINSSKLEISIDNFLTYPGTVSILIGIAGILLNIFSHINYKITNQLDNLKNEYLQLVKNNLNKI